MPTIQDRHLSSLRQDLQGYTQGLQIPSYPYSFEEHYFVHLLSEVK